MRSMIRLLPLKHIAGFVAALTVLALAFATPGVAFAAAGGHGGDGGHGDVAAHGRGGGHPGSIGHPGFTRHGFVGHPAHPHFFHGRPGFVAVAPGFGWWPYSYYEGPAYYGAPADGRYWYYCPSPRTYYPYVAACPEGWVPVPTS